MQLLRGRTTRTRSLAVSPDSRYVAAAGAVTCHVWDLHNPKAKPQALESRINFIRSLQFTTSNDLIAWVGAQWRCYSVAAGYAEWFEFPVDTETDSSIFHPTGTLLKNRARLGSVDTYDLTIRNSATLTNTREIANLQYLRRFNPATYWLN